MSERRILVSLLIGIPVVILYGCLGCGAKPVAAPDPVAESKPEPQRPPRERIVAGQIKQAGHEMLPPLDAAEVPAWSGVRVSVVGRLISAKPCEQIEKTWYCLIVPKDERCGYRCYVREGRARGLSKMETYSVSGDFVDAVQGKENPTIWIIGLNDCDLDWHAPER